MTHAQRTPDRTPAASCFSGTLGTSPLAHVLVSLARKEKTGTLSVLVEGTESLVLFEHGAPAKAHTPWPVPYLGVLLARMGVLDEAAYEETLTEARRSRSLHGSVLLERGLVSRSALDDALREQTALRVLEVFRRYSAASTFEFHPNHDFLAQWGAESTPVDPWRVLWYGCSMRSVDPAAVKTLSLLGDEPVTIRPDAALHRFGFGPSEHRALHWMRSHPSSIQSFFEANWLPADRMQTLLYVLFLTHCLAFPAPSTERPHGTPSDQARRRSPAVPASGTMPRVSESSIPSAPSAPQSSTAGFRDMAPVSGKCEGSREPFSDAGDSLSGSNPRRSALQASLRRIYKSPSTCPPAPEPPLVDAARLLADAQDERRLGDLTNAEVHARQALEARPSDPLIQTELGWILALQPKRRQVGDLGEALQLAKDAIRKNPDLDGPYCVQGIIYQALGMHEQAYRSFRKAVAINRRCSDAITELDVYKRRHRETGSLEPSPESAPSGLGGVLSRLFK